MKARPSSRPLGFLLLLALLSPTGRLQAATINYGDFSGSTALFQNVSETATTPGDLEPLFGAPNIHGNMLEFDPLGFAASAFSGSADLTDGLLSFTVSSSASYFIDSLQVTERGDFALVGNGTSSTRVNYGVALSSVKVLAVDGVTLPTPVSLGGASASGSVNLGTGERFLNPWSLALSYDVATALDNSGIPHVNGVTKLEVSLDNLLTAISEASTIAHLAKKDFTLTAGTDTNRASGPPVPVPEPGGLALLSLALPLLLRLRRRGAPNRPS